MNGIDKIIWLRRSGMISDGIAERRVHHTNAHGDTRAVNICDVWIIARRFSCHLGIGDTINYIPKEFILHAVPT
jgi:hypothetical protein